MIVDFALTPQDLLAAVQRVFETAAPKCRQLDDAWDRASGTPVFTVGGSYDTRGWTEWTQGFQYGCQILAGEGVGDDDLIQRGLRHTVDDMLPHVTHIGVHDHGFNNLSTYGNLLRLMAEGRLPEDTWQRRTFQNAIAVSGAVQAARWSATSCGLGYVYSFNGPHSLFIDTMRTIRILNVAHQLGHCLMAENDERVSLLKRSVQHGLATGKYIVFDGTSDHTYDVRGRTAHEGTFNRNDGRFRSRATQQGYSPFSTWTRGLAWAMLGYAEQLEWLATIDDESFAMATHLDKPSVVQTYLQKAIDTCDHYIDDVTAADGITYWDDGAPGLHNLGLWRESPAQPANDYEPVDASASAIAAQGLLRLGAYLAQRPAPIQVSQESPALEARSADPADQANGNGSDLALRYQKAGLSVARTLFSDYLSLDEDHQGLLLHSVYHWPNRWDHIPEGKSVAFGESSMWGDYHLLELALLTQRLGTETQYPTFFQRDRD